MPKLVDVKLNLNIPGFGGIEGTWTPDKDQRSAAWELYVELVTRISVARLQSDEGLLREALSSLHTIFETGRSILRKYGPRIATPKGKGHLSFGYITVAILNYVLRPILTKWHPLLLEYENQREDTISALEHEERWEQGSELRQAINDVREILIEYANLLAEVAGVPSLIIEQPE